VIAKGTPHKNGAVLARYLVTGKESEAAELWQLRGFAFERIVDAFRSIHVMAEGTRCAAPFFHVYVRNREGESLNREQWEQTADAIERVLGLDGQPRAIAFHTAADTGDCHMHIAFSRIDQDTLTAKPLPFYKQRLKKASRELEELFALPPVPNHRESSIQFAPTRAEEEQGRRLDVDVKALREDIRHCFERSDCGATFAMALAKGGLILARGDSRDFLVLDREGGIHALGKRILGVSAAQIRSRLSDLGHDRLPTVEQARASLCSSRIVARSTQVDPPPCMPERFSKATESEPCKSKRVPPRKQVRAAGKDRVHPTARVQGPRVPDSPAAARPLPETPPHVLQQPTDISTDDQVLHLMPDLPCSPLISSPSPSIVPETFHQIAGPSLACGTKPVVPDDGPLPMPDPPVPVPVKTRFASQLKSQFRALVKQLIARDPIHNPARRKRRRDETGRGFRQAASALLRRLAWIPPLHFLDPDWEPFTWLRISEYNCTASTGFSQNCSVSPPPEDLTL
jgi:hypothetical protein